MSVSAKPRQKVWRSVSAHQRRIRLCGVAPLVYQYGEARSSVRQRWLLKGTVTKTTSVKSVLGIGAIVVRTLFLGSRSINSPMACMLSLLVRFPALLVESMWRSKADLGSPAVVIDLAGSALG
jgi:hypothetical protein